jgi:hypothetical protein
MKTLIFFLLVPSFLMADLKPPIPFGSVAAQAAAHKTPLPENHQIILTLLGRTESPLEIALTVGAPFFSIALDEHGLAFSGTLESLTGATAVLDYTLQWETPISAGAATVYKKSETHGVVRLELGKELMLLQAGKHQVKVTVQKSAKP